MRRGGRCGAGGVLARVRLLLGAAAAGAHAAGAGGAPHAPHAPRAPHALLHLIATAADQRPRLAP